MLWCREEKRESRNVHHASSNPQQRRQKAGDQADCSKCDDRSRGEFHRFDPGPVGRQEQSGGCGGRHGHEDHPDDSSGKPVQQPCACNGPYRRPGEHRPGCHEVDPILEDERYRSRSGRYDDGRD